jgi:RNA polymerase sigma-70 factor (ECF subfamily)
MTTTDTAARGTPTPSFEDVYRTHAARVYRYCLSQVSSAHDAEDLAADVFASACRAYPTAGVTVSTVLPWLLRIARNGVIDHRRRRTRRTAVVDRYFGAASEADPANVAEEVVLRDEVRRVLEAMRHLSEKDRAVLGLRVAAGLPHAEVAAVLGVSEHAATMAAKRALTRLRKHLAPTR